MIGSVQCALVIYELELNGSGKKSPDFGDLN
jgi:hypothetical protein